MNLKYRVGIVEYDFSEIIDEFFAEEYRQETKEIVEKVLNSRDMKSHFLIMEWIVYIERDMGNLVCLHVDSMKEFLERSEFDSEKYVKDLIRKMENDQDL